MGTVDATTSLYLYFDDVYADSKQEAEQIMIDRAEQTPVVDWEVSMDGPRDLTPYIEEEHTN